MTDTDLVAWLRELLDTDLGPDDRPWIEAIADRLEALARDSARLDKRLADWEEREAACCPEEFVFEGVIRSQDEVIKSLREKHKQVGKDKAYVIEQYDKLLRANIAQLEKRLSEWEEREAACCPEDVGFDEVIKSLRAKVAQLEWPFTWDDVDFLRGRSPTFEPERFLNILADLIALRLPPREAR